MENVSSRCGNRDNAPRLRFPEFSGEWVEKKIKEFANCYAGATPSTKERKYWENGTIPWLSSGEVNKKHISFTDNFITKIGYDSCSTKMIPANTVVMALAGQGKTRGTVAITEIELCTNQSLASIVTNEAVDDKFLLYYLETQYSNLRAISSGDGTRGGLNLNIINEYSVFLSSLPEQKKIAAFFTLLDRRIQKQRQLVECLKTYKRGVLQRVFSKKHECEELSIEDIFSCIIDKNHPDKTVLTIVQGTGTVPRNSIDRKISYDAASVSSYKKVKENDFILHLRSFEGGLEIANEEGIVSPAYTILRPTKNISPLFYYNYFRSYTFINEKLRIAVEGIRDGKSINMNTFWKIKVPFPPFELQNYYASFFSLLDKNIKKNDLLLQTLEKEKRQLLQRMFI